MYIQHTKILLLLQNRVTEKKEGIPVGTTVHKWGNSLAIRIPQSVIKATAIDQGTELEWYVEDHSIILTITNKKPTLEELLSNITPENRHSEIEWGRKGKELL
jgi:antitoxin MazE